MNYQALIPSLRQWLTPPVFPDKEQTRAARWLNFILLVLITLISGNSTIVLLGGLDQKTLFQILLSNAFALIVSIFALILMRNGHVKLAAFILLALLSMLVTYAHAFIFQSMRTPSITVYFVLIPLAGLLMGRWNMNMLAALCLLSILVIFCFEMAGILTPSLSSRSIFDDLFVLFFSLVMNTLLFNASAKRLEEKAEEINRTAVELTVTNQELYHSQLQLQEARAELEQKVRQRTSELQQSNAKLQEEVKHRQQLLHALASSEANWRSLAEQVSEVIARINNDGTISFINRTINGITPEKLIGQHASIIHSQKKHQVLLEKNIATVFQAGETVSYESEEIKEEARTWRINRIGAIYQNDQVTAVILTSTDITEQKQTEAAMYQMQKLESLGVLAGGVAHDFNNLLSVMLMQLSLGLTKLPMDHPVRQNLERTLKAAERATELTRQMLNYAGRSPTETKQLNLNELITDNIHLFSASISKNINLTAELSKSAPIISGDKGQLQQLIMNLIINSADAIGGKPGDICIVTKIQELTKEEVTQDDWGGTVLTAGHYIRFEVHDTGCGMDAQTLSKIFDPFFTTKFTGRGLGLASVIGIVRAHKGGLHVSSVVGRGTTFSILFPTTTKELQLAVPIPTTSFVGTGELVLVIDDEAPVCESMADILREAGLKVLCTTDGATALHLFREHRHELRLVLLDLAMPGMSGEEVFHQFMTIDTHIPIVLVSGYSEADVVERFVNKQLAGFVQKPYTAEVLLQYVQAHLRTLN